MGRVLLVQRTVRTQVAEGRIGQPQTPLDLVGRHQGQGHAGAFEHVHHAKEAQRVAARDHVVGIGHHDLGGQGRPAMAHGLGVRAAGGDVVQDPLVVALFFLHVLVHGVIEPGVVCRQGGLARLEQRHRVAYMVIGLREEGHVAGDGDPALQGALDDGDRQQFLLGQAGLGDQLVVKGHGVLLKNHAVAAGTRASAWRWKMASRCGRPLAVAMPLAVLKGSWARTQ